MLLFCPACSNLLTITNNSSNTNNDNSNTNNDNSNDDPDAGRNRFECKTCPYEYVLRHTYFERTEMPRTEVEDVLGDVDADGGGMAERTEIQCPREGCDSFEAQFCQVQLRSADEPMTTIFSCVKCGNRWRDG